MPDASAIDAVNCWSFAFSSTGTTLHHGVSGSMGTPFSTKTVFLPQVSVIVQSFSTRVEWKPRSILSLPWRSTLTAPSIVTFFTPPMPFTGNQYCFTVRVSDGAIHE